MSKYPPLTASAVHVHHYKIHSTALLAEKYSQFLSGNEMGRVNQYRSPALRERFIIQHGILREVLAQYLALDPIDICYQYTDTGKPVIDGLQFNLSHSGVEMAVAVSSVFPLGIDIECSHREINQSQIAKIIFSLQELQDWNRLPELERKTALLQTWTVKEAHLKALGIGLNHSLKHLTLEESPDSSTIHVIDDVNGMNSTVMILNFTQSTMVGAVAVTGCQQQPPEICLFEEIGTA